MKKSTVFPFVALLIILFTACSKTTDAPADPATNTQQDNAEKVLAYIKELGFPASSIVEKSTEFIVEEDISFPKNMQVPEGKLKTEQYYTGSLVSAANVANIRLFVDPSMTSMMSEINSAIAQWNAVANCNINWVVATSAPYNVRIVDANLGSNVCGSGTFPSGGLPGALIRINKALIAGNSFAQRARTICHEMGHNVSFRHTNWASIGESSATPVPGVGGTDAASLMNGGQCGSGATVLSTKDKQAAAALY